MKAGPAAEAAPACVTIADMSAVSPPRTRLWDRAEYERMIETGILGPEDRVELLQGEIVEISPERSRHATAVDLSLGSLRRAFGPGFTIRVQHPLSLGDRSEPEPDLAVVSGSPRDYASRHPASAALAVEVADTSLEHDRTRKATIYAQSGILEYWIVNLVDQRLEVYHDPAPEGYRSVAEFERGGTLSPIAAPRATVAVSDLLP